jgi:hypothetical protein
LKKEDLKIFANERSKGSFASTGDPLMKKGQNALWNKYW